MVPCLQALLALIRILIYPRLLLQGALEDIYEEHKYVATEQEAACAAIVNGTCDVCSGAVYHDALIPAVQVCALYSAPDLVVHSSWTAWPLLA
jgi:hypothetical protein